MLLYSEKHQLGDYVEKDGVPSIVVYVDETGEHGLLLSMKARIVREDDLPKLEKLNERERKNMTLRFKNRLKYYHYARAKKQGTEAIAQVDARYERQLGLMEKYLAMPPIIHTKRYEKLIYYKLEKYLGDFIGQISGSGKDNTQLILNVCYETNVQISDYFPEFAWATSLGPDWFIPGNDELELIAKSMGSDGLGEHNTIIVPKPQMTMSYQKNLETYYAIFDSINSSVAYLVRNMGLGLDTSGFAPGMKGDDLWPIWSLRSSTLVASNWSQMGDNKSKTKWLDLVIDDDGKTYLLPAYDYGNCDYRRQYYSLRCLIKNDIYCYYMAFAINGSNASICAMSKF